LGRREYCIIGLVLEQTLSIIRIAGYGTRWGTIY
jgi:hypothetical protein